MGEVGTGRSLPPVLSSPGDITCPHVTQPRPPLNIEAVKKRIGSSSVRYGLWLQYSLQG